MTSRDGRAPAEASRLSLTIDCSAERTAVIRLCGELDLATGHLVADVFALVERETSGPVVIDAAGLTFCDAFGLGRIVALRQLLQRHGRDLELRPPSPQLRRLLELARLSALVDVPAPPPTPGPAPHGSSARWAS